MKKINQNEFVRMLAKSLTCLGTITPDPVGQALKTGMDRFSSPWGVDGLCRVVGVRVDILAIASQTPGKGQLRSFITALKGQFKHIRVMHIDNPILVPILARYGFVPFQDVESIEGETEFITGMEWKI